MIVKSSRSLCGTGVLALLLSASVAQAAVSITGNVAGSAAPTVNNTYGTLEFALNMGGAPESRDGITYTTAGTTPSGAVRTFLSNGGVGSTIDVVGTSTGPGWSTHSFGGDTLFHTIAYVDSNGGYTIDLTDLDAAKSYQVQFLFGDPRSDFPYSGRTVTVSDSLANTDTAILTYGSGAAGDEFAMLTAVVSGSTSFQFISPVSGTGSGAPLLSGVVVHSIPEPSTALLGGLGLLGLLRRRRA
jgi:hypothetical protein